MRTALLQALIQRAPRASFSLIAPAVLATVVSGCGDSGGGSSPPPVIQDPSVKIEPEHNYSFTSSLTVPEVTTAAGTSMHVCWDQVATDVQGHAVDPTADINDVSLVRVASSNHTTVEQWLNTELSAMDTNGSWEVLPSGGDKCADFSDFTAPSSTDKMKPDTDYVVNDMVTYLLVFASGTTIGHGARTMLFLNPSEDSNVTKVNALADSRSILDLKVDMHSLTKLPVKAEEAPVIDWGDVKLTGQQVDGQGLPIAKNSIDSILVGFFKDKEPKDLEAGFLNLQQATEDEGGPTRSWELSVPKGTTADLSQASGRADEGAFVDFQTSGETGTWLIGLFCSTCTNPAPLIVSILDPQ
jgi:hypothetical protein